MKKRGSVLLEIITVLSILSILFCINVAGFKYYKSHIEKIEKREDLYEIREILSFAREYCYENETYGELYFDNSEEFTKVYLVSQGKVVKSISFSEGKKLGNSNCVADNKRMIEININKNGYLSPYTIRLIDKDRKENKIIIQVGGNLVYIKDE